MSWRPLNMETTSQTSSYVAVVAYGQEVSPTWPLHCGYLRTGGVEALNDACHSA